jgi:hypothetical protein
MPTSCAMAPISPCTSTQLRQVSQVTRSDWVARHKRYWRKCVSITHSPDRVASWPTHGFATWFPGLCTRRRSLTAVTAEPSRTRQSVGARSDWMPNPSRSVGRAYCMCLCVLIVDVASAVRCCSCGLFDCAMLYCGWDCHV